MNESVETERPNPSIASQAVGAVIGVAAVYTGLRVILKVQDIREARKIRNAEKTSAIKS